MYKLSPPPKNLINLLYKNAVYKWSSKKFVTAPSKTIDSFCLPQFQGKVIPDDRTIVPKTVFKEVSAGQWNNQFVLIVPQIIRDISLSKKGAKIIRSKAM